MNEDLEVLKQQIEERKQQLVVSEPVAPAITFEQTEKPLPVKRDTAQELVDNAFGQAIVNRVVENKEVQKNLLDSADTVIQNKLNAIREKADQEDKEASFNNNKNACECFGYNEATTSKWAVKTMKVWHDIMTALWIVIGSVTFAPVTFIAKKINVIFKKSWLAILVAVVLYLIFTAAPIVTGLLIK